MKNITINAAAVVAISSLVLVSQSLQNLAFFVDEISYLSQPLMLRNIARTLVYVLCYTVSAAAVISVILLRQRIFVLLLLTVFVLSYTIDISFQLLGNPAGLDLNEYEILRGNMSMAGNAVEYFVPIASSFLISLAIVALLCLFRRNTFAKLRSDWFLLVPVVAVAMTTFASIKVFSINPSSFPAPIKLFSVGAYYEIERSDYTHYKREFDKSLVASHEGAKNIIWIIDESVAGDYLSINGFQENTTPFLANYNSSANMYNFGVVNSVATNSSLSNLLLRVGMQPKHANDFVDKLYRLPTIYQFAKHAGYETTLFDMQMSNGALQNGLTAKDLQDIDNYITASRGMTVAFRDISIINDLESILKSHEKNFIVIVKWGAHWPYQQSYPKSEEVFTPVLDTMLANVISGNRERRINTYLNAIRYSADRFLERLISTLDLRKCRIIYTSDHGQDLAPDAKRTHGSHVRVADPMVEVPLIVFQSEAKAAFDKIPANSQSSFQIFPTTLDWMGYNRNVFSRYGKTLNIHASEELRSFFVTSTGELQKYRRSIQ